MSRQGSCIIRFDNVEYYYRTGLFRRIPVFDRLTGYFSSGDRVALVGDNGVGKSTFLKLCSGVLRPTQGAVYSAGKILSVLSLSQGLFLPATGVENLELICRLNGMSALEYQRNVSRMIEVLDLGERIHDPIRTYSRGMKARIGLVPTLFCRPNALLLDEVIGAGDQKFMAVIASELEFLIDEVEILIFASHNQHLVSRFCTNALSIGRFIESFEGQRLDKTAK